MNTSAGPDSLPVINSLGPSGTLTRSSSLATPWNTRMISGCSGSTSVRSLASDQSALAAKVVRYGSAVMPRRAAASRAAHPDGSS